MKNKRLLEIYKEMVSLLNEADQIIKHNYSALEYSRAKYNWISKISEHLGDKDVSRLENLTFKHFIKSHHIDDNIEELNEFDEITTRFE